MTKKLKLKQKSYSSIQLEAEVARKEGIIIWIHDTDEESHTAINLTEQQARDLADWIVNNTGI